MAVIQVGTFTVKPDAYEAQMEVNRKSKAVFERLGAKNVRVLSAFVAGEASGAMSFVFEADDFADYGSIMDKFLADAEGAALFASLNTSAGTNAGMQVSIWMDVL